MRVGAMRPLFAWECLEDSPSLRTVKEFLAAIPDGKLLASLRASRHRGRNDYPVGALWGTLLLQIVLRHPTTEACLAELRRNEGLRRLIGIESEGGVPNKWNMSRFLDALGREPHLSLLRGVFDEIARRLGEAVEDLGRHASGDATHLSARRSRARGGAAGLPEARGGRKEYVDENGSVEKVVEWFGHKLHALVDSRHEVAVAYRIGPANEGDNEALPELVEQAGANLPEGRMETLACDKAADDKATHALLASKGISPVVKTRAMWKDEPERILPGRDGRSKAVCDEAGTVYCYDTVSDPPVVRPMAYIGHEASRGTLKYRCPARHRGEACAQESACNGKGGYGRAVRVKREIDLRRFPPIPRATKKFERLHRGRSSVERFNARLKVYWGADDGNITGAARFHAHVGAVMVVHAAMATLLAAAPRREGTLGKMRLAPVARALRETWSG